MLPTVCSHKGYLLKSRGPALYALVLLTLINFLNYTDRCIVSAVLPHLQMFFNVTSGEAGYILTSFVVASMIVSPICGYLGDRISRKWIVIVGIAFWAFFTLAGSFVGPNNYWLFVAIRGMVGVGEASYSTVAYSILGDLFTRKDRLVALGIFSLAVPFGTGAGYITGEVAYEVASKLVSASDQKYAWQWAFRITPALGVICCILSIIFLPDPARGNADDVPDANEKTSVFTDIIILSQNRSVVFATLGYIAIDFVAGSLGFWAPTYVDNNHADAGVPFGGIINFGIVSIIGGIGGVFLGVYASKALKIHSEMIYADAFVSGIGMLISAVSLYGALLLLKPLPWLGWILVLCTVITSVLNWPLLPNILIETVIPTRRSLVSGLSNFIANILGYAISPVVIGYINDQVLYNSTPYISLQYGLMINVLMAAFGGALFLISALFFQRDFSICQSRMALARNSFQITENL